MKHLKLRARMDSKDPSVCYIEVLEQTHRQEKFGNFNPRGRGNNSFVHGEVAMISMGLPAYSSRKDTTWSAFLPEQVNQVLFLQGWDVENDNKIVKAPSILWPVIREAVEAYNEYFKD